MKWRMAKGNRLDCAQVKEMDMVSYLSALGYEPARTGRNDYWYHSPLRDEKTPSFKINRRLNRWYDFGAGEGGNLIDFGILYHNCTVSELLRLISCANPPPSHTDFESTGIEKESRVTVQNVVPLYAYPLLQYLEKRGISTAVANLYCREVSFMIKDKTYYGIGFENDKGGYEIRNAFFKTGSSPKTVTTILNGANRLSVFEGFFDFLSLQSIHNDQHTNSSDFLILNSVSFFEKSMPFMEQYDCIELYLDRDTTGQNCSRMAMKRSKRYLDKSQLYNGYKDLNDWLMYGRNNSG